MYICFSFGSMYAQTLLTIEGTTVNNTTDDTWSGVNIPRSTPTIFTYRNNSITSVNTYGYMLQAGDEGQNSENNNLDGEVITGNQFTWNGTNLISITHGVFTGYTINAVIEYNYLNKVPMGIIRKSDGMTNTSGGVAYNIIKNPVAVGAVVKGMNGVKFYNNTFYSNQHMYVGPGDGTWRGLIDIYANDSFNPWIPSTGTKIFNNIFYTVNQIFNIYIYEVEDLPGFESDYNVFYCESGEPIFNYLGSSKTFTQWQALGYDTHSVVVNPHFINLTDFVPSARLNYGTDLGATWQTGLSIDAVWGTTDPATTNQNGTWQVGARVHTGNVFYLSPTGSDATGNGSIISPWFTLNKAWTVVSAGDLIYMRGGIYQYVSKQDISGKNGSNGNKIKVYAYPGEQPTITKASSYVYSGWRVLVYFSGNYVHFKGIEIMGNPQITSDMYVGMVAYKSNNCIFELLNVHHSGMGFWLRDDPGDNSNNNLFLNCDIHHNQDPLTAGDPYGNGDGLGININTGNTVTAKGCRFWWNTDDGIDPYGSDATIIIDNCWAFYNGYIPGTFNTGGNGNGFKLGITTTDHGNTILMSLKNNLAFKNRTAGFHQNGALCGVELYNNTAFDNGNEGFYFYLPTRVHILKNNIAYDNYGTTSISAGSTLTANTFLYHSDNNPAYPLSDADFISLDTTGVTGARGSDGSLPVLDFLRLASTSNLIDAGVDVGLPFSGTAPDIGAFEYMGENHAPSIMNQSFQVNENSPDGTVAGTVLASDTDADQALEYSIVSGNTDGAFTINTSNGELSVANSTAVINDFVLVVKVQDNGVGKLSSQATITINVIPTGIESTGNNSTIKVYPNPVSDKLIIEIEGNIDRPGFEILNSIGNIVFKGTLSEKTVVQTTNFSTGVYFIKLQNGEILEFKKIVKL
jgi:hypothetical protein